MEKPNMDYIDNLCGDNTEFREKLVGILKTELIEETEEYKNLLKLKDYKKAAGNVHKLKHKISLLGLEKSFYIAEQFEINLNNDDTKLQDEFEGTLEIMQKFVKEL